MSGWKTVSKIDEIYLKTWEVNKFPHPTNVIIQAKTGRFEINICEKNKYF